jgi:hypothetical protein
VLCAGCRTGSSAAGSDVRPETLAALLDLQAGGGAPPPSGAVGAEARELLTSHLEHQLGRRLHARRFLDEIASML